MSKNRNQKGVALLFALGILSLILVTGLAFLGNSLISQKIAFNLQEANAAKVLARSAADRAIAQLAMFNLLQAGYHARYYASDASSVFSRIDDAVSAPAGATAILTKNNADQSVTQDQLSGEKSKLNVDVFRSGSSRYPWYAGKSSRAKWIYVHKNGVESNGYTSNTEPIIGRYAYQVLPQTSNSRVSLYAVTKGSFGNVHPAVEQPDSADKVKIAKQFRWGIDVDELLINDALFKDWGGADKSTGPTPDGNDLSQREFDTFFNIFSGTGSPLYLSNSATDPQKKTVEVRKRWVRNIFTEGMGRVAREAYPDNSSLPYSGLRKWYSRFNLGEFKPYFDANKTDGIWYSRFRSKIPETDNADEEKKAIDELKNGLVIPPSTTKSVLDYLAGDAPVPFVDGYVKDREYSSPVGLPFLRRLGHNDEMGGFSKIEDLRKQIAANLNDYCDADSIPTSDVAADKWKDLVDKTDDDLPKFTGNEQTPYINELAFGFKMSDGKITAETGKCDFEAKFTPEIIAELIRVYKSTPGITGTQLHGFIKSLGVTLKVTVSGTATGSYKKSVDGVETTVTVPEFNLNDLLIEGSDISYSEFKNKKFEIPFDTGVGGPYWVKNFQFTDAADVISVKASLYQKLRELSGTTDNEVSFTVNPTKIKVEISKVSFNLGNLVLTATVDGKENVGIDFVRFINPPGDSETFSVTSDKAKEYTSMTDLSKDGIFHVGVMQAIDPRQNLNAVFQRNGTSVSTSLKSSDWLLSKDASLQFTADDSKWEWGNLTTRVTGGGINTYSNPSAPKYADGSEMTAQNHCDTEETKDPAWSEDSKEKHISTAVIRNAPMRSPWELGFIHRGIPFQTINLKKAGGIDGGELLDPGALGSINCSTWNEAEGTKYAYGDAGILEQIKMTEYNKSYGKVDLAELKKDSPAWAMGSSVESYNKAIFQSLFHKLGRCTAQKFIERSKFVNFFKDSVPDWGDEISNPITNAEWGIFKGLSDNMFRTQLLENENLRSKLALGTNDAQQEELIGRTFNLIEGSSCSVPNTFQIVIVAQTIRDLSDDVIRQNSKSEIVKSSDSDKGLGRMAELGRFDAHIGSDLGESVYFDEILSECRMLVTVEKIHYLETVGTAKVPRARLRVKQIEYLD